MPFYEYRCKKCGHTLTAMQSMSAAPLTTCPQCHEESLEKLISASGIDMKGIGVFGNSKNPFQGDSCAAANASSAAANASGSPCASCPHHAQ